MTVHAPDARAEIDRLEANSKLFRTLVVVFALAAVHYLLREQQLGLAAASAALCVLSFSRYFDQRWKMTELSYASAVIVAATKSADKAAKDDRAPKEGSP